MKDIIPYTEVVSQIYYLRGTKVMLDFHLAVLYGVETRVLKQQVKRNLVRFPSDFMFVLNEVELKELVSQNVIPSKGQFGGALPFAFTEQGVAMLAGVLRSERAIEVNIEIMRAFVRMRALLESNKELHQKLSEMESKYDKQFKIVFEAMRELLDSERKPRKPISINQERDS